MSGRRIVAVIVGACMWVIVAGAGRLTHLLALQAQTAVLSPTAASCPVTRPNGQVPPGEQPDAQSYGNGALWTILWRDGTVIFEPDGSGFLLANGSLKMKFPWWRSVSDPLTITGKRLDAPAAPLRAEIPAGYSGRFQATSLVFPTEGCWEVTGRVGEASLTFVTRVVNHRTH